MSVKVFGPCGTSALESHRPRLMRYLQRRGTPPEDAEDLLQDLSELVLRRRLPEHPDAAARWLFTCLRWLITRRRRRASTAPAMAESVNGEAPPLDEVPDRRGGPEQAVLEQSVCAEVMQALDTLRSADRELLLAVADGTPAAALAREQGVTRQAVTERVHRARRELVASLPYDVFEA